MLERQWLISFVFLLGPVVVVVNALGAVVDSIFIELGGLMIRVGKTMWSLVELTVAIVG